VVRITKDKSSIGRRKIRLRKQCSRTETKKKGSGLETNDKLSRSYNGVSNRIQNAERNKMWDNKCTEISTYIEEKQKHGNSLRIQQQEKRKK